MPHVKGSDMKRIIMVSLDAVSSSDLAHLLNYPNFARLKEQSTLVSYVSSVFISNTYPAHSSIITGVHPHKHELVDNLLLNPEKTWQDWRFNANLIKAPKLYDKAKDKGLRTCAILYPVTGQAAIRYNFPEIPGHMSLVKRFGLMMAGGSPGFILGSLLRFGRHFRGVAQPSLDDLTIRIAADALIRRRPELLLLHLLDTDDQKHRFGPQSQQARASLERHDRRLGLLIQALQTAGTYEETGILIFSDHGCLPVHTTADPNDFLVRKGLAQKERGRATRFEAYFHNAGCTAFLKIYNEQRRGEIEATARQILAEGYVLRELTPEEMRISGMDKEYALGIEAAGGFAFGEPHLGQHGYALCPPENQPFYMAKGEGIPQGAELRGGSIVDICPLAAEMLELPLWSMDGENRIKRYQQNVEK
jgi:predicted AlkP superfamily pyrophosphatase or phosphodiesterase